MELDMRIERKCIGLHDIGGLRGTVTTGFREETDQIGDKNALAWPPPAYLPPAAVFRVGVLAARQRAKKTVQ
jgi:hypothetical protein